MTSDRFTRAAAAVRELLQASTDAEIGQGILEAATTLLDVSYVTVFRFDETDGTLHPIAHSPEVVDPPTVVVDEEGVGQAFADARITVLDDVRSGTELRAAGEGAMRYLAVPFGGYGVLVGGYTSPGDLDEGDGEHAALLATAAETAFDRATRGEELSRHRREVERLTHRYVQLEAVNDRCRALRRAATSGGSRLEIEQAVCDELVAFDEITFAWLGSVDSSNGPVTPRAWAGSEQGYLEYVSTSVDEAREPGVRTAKTLEPTVVSNTTAAVQTEPWMREAHRRGFRSALSVPLVHRGVAAGVLAAYGSEADTFDGTLGNALIDSADVVAFALAATDRKYGLLTDRLTELDFELDDPACVFYRLAERTGCSLVFDGAVPRRDGEPSVFVTVVAGSVDDVLDYADDSPGVEGARVLQETEAGPLVRVRFADPFVASVLADHGIVLRRIATEGQRTTMTVGIPPTMRVHHAVDVVTAEYPNSEFVAKRESANQNEIASLPRRLLEGITDRQREALRRAYAEGYFDSPKGATGGTIAEMMGLSSSAFNEHLRGAQRSIFGELFDE